MYYPRMGAKVMYLVRGPDGRMSTVIAQSNRGALNKYCSDNRKLLAKGDEVSVKVRGGTDPWVEYTITQ
jgi:hypothetical protein